MCINNVYSDLVCSVGDYETAVHSYHQKGQKYVMRFQRSKGKGLLWHCLYVVVVLLLATVWILEEEKGFHSKIKGILYHLPFFKKQSGNTITHPHSLVDKSVPFMVMRS